MKLRHWGNLLKILLLLALAAAGYLGWRFTLPLPVERLDDLPDVRRLAQPPRYLIPTPRRPPRTVTPLEITPYPTPTPGPYVPVYTEALDEIGAAEYHAQGLRGQGVKIAVIDDRYEGLAASLATGELPRTAITRHFYTNGTSDVALTDGRGPHGVACAEIVHDVAPDAQLYLIQVQSLSRTIADVLAYLHAEGVQVVSISMSVLSAEPELQRLYHALDWASERGMLVVVSAGNYARQHYRGPFRDRDGDGWHEFSEASVEQLVLYPPAASTLLLQLGWEGEGGPFRLHVSDEQGQEVRVSRHAAEDARVFSVWLRARGGTPYALAISRAGEGVAGGGPPAVPVPTLDLFVKGDTAPLLAYQLPAHSLAYPADTGAVLTVGAADVATDHLLSTSSRGPAGDRYGDPARIKPDLTGYAQVSVAVAPYGPRGFGGTSSAAPHVAGMAALLLSQSPGASRCLEFSQGCFELVRSRLLAFARDAGPPGPDTAWGAGIARLPPLGIQVALLPPLPYHATTGASTTLPLTLTIARSDGTPLHGLSRDMLTLGTATHPFTVVRALDVGPYYLLEAQLPAYARPRELPVDLYVGVLHHRRRLPGALVITAADGADAPALLSDGLHVTVLQRPQVVGDPLVLRAVLPGADSTAAGGLERFAARVARPDPATQPGLLPTHQAPGETVAVASTRVDSLFFYDDGMHGDGVAGDGVYAAHYPRTQLAGWYTVTLAAPRELVSVSGDGGDERLDGEGGAAAASWQLTFAVDGNPPDADGDGMPDNWEAAVALNPRLGDAYQDPDGDGLINLDEYRFGGDPANWDSDGDGLYDGAEVYGYYRTNPASPDTDLGGVGDAAELEARFGPHTNPLDPTDDYRPLLLIPVLEVR